MINFYQQNVAMLIVANHWAWIASNLTQWFEAAIFNQYAVAHWWSSKFIQEGCETFHDVTIFWYL